LAGTNSANAEQVSNLSCKAGYIDGNIFFRVERNEFEFNDIDFRRIIKKRCMIKFQRGKTGYTKNLKEL
jgi:hypothetical protein